MTRLCRQQMGWRKVVTMDVFRTCHENCSRQDWSYFRKLNFDALGEQMNLNSTPIYPPGFGQMLRGTDFDLLQFIWPLRHHRECGLKL